MSGLEIVTLGCRLNTFESEVMRAEAGGLANAVIINTCAVTAEAERQARQTIRRLRRQKPGARIIVTGCAAQLHPEVFAAMPEVDRVLGNAEKLDRAALTDEARDIQVSDIMEARETAHHLVAGFEGRTRAFVQIQQGCDRRCTFCIVPFARGPNRSLEPAAIVEQARMLNDNGHAEVVLTGVDISSYGLDRSGLPGLGALATRVLDEVPNLRRLRLTSLDPAMIDDDVLGLLADEPRFMPHLHLSLQAADDMVLKRMKRRHTRADSIDICSRARAARPGVVLGADLITGFPTETDAMFENTLSAVEELGLTFLHVFPFSPRDDTPAARMPQVPGPKRKARAARLRAAGEAALARWLESRVGTTAEVLMEEPGRGRCPHFAAVRLTQDQDPGTVVTVKITGTRGAHLIGEPLS